MKILLALSLVALVGCAGRPWIHGIRINDDGSILNDTGRDLHQVKLEGTRYAHGQKVDLYWGIPRFDWDKGETIPNPWPYRMESVDRLDLYGKCTEGGLYTVFPDSSPRRQASAPEPEREPVPQKAADKSTWRNGVPPCDKCSSWHWPDQPHVAGTR